MSVTITMPVRGYVRMDSPYDDLSRPGKHRFYVSLANVSSDLLNWMSTNPREQNLSSQVSKSIAASMRTDHGEFHLRNRGVLLSAKEVSFFPMNGTSGTIGIHFEDPGLHGNLDGGHTLRLILQALASKEGLPEQYVEFEVITGLKSAIEVAEARNASVALDVRSLEAMKGSYDVLKEVFAGVKIGSDPFFTRVELKMNQMREEKNSIDVRTLISILLMFNQDLFPNDDDQTPVSTTVHPIQMYGGKEAALKKYLDLGNGDPESRNDVLRKMAPIFIDIVKLWDTIERELPVICGRKYASMRFATARKAPLSMFSNAPLPYCVPQSLLFPAVAAFRSLVRLQPDGTYFWAEDPLLMWEESKKSFATHILAELKSFKNNPTTIAKNKTLWNGLYLQIEVAALDHFLKRNTPLP